MNADDLSKNAKSSLIRALATAEAKLRADAELSHSASESKVSEQGAAYFRENEDANRQAAEFISKLCASLIA